MENKIDLENRVVVLIDMDCFYCQVEEKLNAELKGMPIAVVQYNPWKGGGIIAVNYPARAQGVNRGMRGDEAREKCPEIQLPSVPCSRGKADISKYREAGKEVARVLQKFTKLLERASIDEAYLDITAPVTEKLKQTQLHSITDQDLPNTFILGYESLDKYISDVANYDSESIDFDHENAKRLLIGAIIVSNIRKAVFDETGYQCSAGIAHNKILAKLVCGMNKPNKQTVLPKHSINILYRTLPLKKVKHLGGKFGDNVCQTLKISKMGELERFSEKELQNKFDEKNGSWLYNIARGTDLEPVQSRFNPKSIGCCKQFKGKQALVDLRCLRKWLKDLGDEIEDRLEKDAVENNRTPRQMVVSFLSESSDGRDVSSSRSYNFTAEDDLCAPLFSSKGLEILLESIYGEKIPDVETNRKLPTPIKFLGLSVGKFEDHADSKKTKKIVDYFSAGTSKDSKDTSKQKKNNKNKGKNNVNKKNDVTSTIQKDVILNTQTDKTLKTQKDETLNTQKDKTLKTRKDETLNTQKDEALNTEKDVTVTSDVETKLDKRKSKIERDFILQKYFETTDKSNLTDAINNESKSPNRDTVESSLDKQESFFARFLNKNKDTDRPTTPQCKVIQCGESSNDSDYSGSTINNEINKSIALFDEDPVTVNRITNIRTLLENTNKTKQTNSEDNSPIIQKLEELSPVKQNTVLCEECRKEIPVHEFETHSDYHLALKLRDEERKEFKNERVRVESKVRDDSKDTKAIANTSFMNFFDRIAQGTPTEICKECNKKVATDKFQEHTDFHEAQRLSREINKKITDNREVKRQCTESNNKKTVVLSTSLKRKIKGISPPSKKKTPPCKNTSITSFFTNR